MNADVKIKSESLWVLCNIIASSSADNLMTVILQYKATLGEVDLLHPLCYNLIKVGKGDSKLLLEMINSIERLLGLDREFPDILQGDCSVMAMVLTLQGFESLEKL